MLSIDFNEKRLRYRAQRLSRRSELIIKALGFKKDQRLHVFDTTAGLGKEAFLMAALGCEVTLFERNSTISALLKDAIERGLLQKDSALICARMKLLETCSIYYLKNLDLAHAPDVIYCDPMFEERAISAASKKDITLLKSTVGEDDDAHELVQEALKIAKKRVVVKRALLAPQLHEKPPIIFKGRSHRYDVYLTKKF